MDDSEEFDISLLPSHVSRYIFDNENRDWAQQFDNSALHCMLHLARQQRLFAIKNWCINHPTGPPLPRRQHPTISRSYVFLFRWLWSAICRLVYIIFCCSSKGFNVRVLTHNGSELNVIYRSKLKLTVDELLIRKSQSCLHGRAWLRLIHCYPEELFRMDFDLCSLNLVILQDGTVWFYPKRRHYTIVIVWCL